MPILSNNNKILSNGSTSGTWRRPEDWLPMPMGITSANQTFVGLHAVIENSDNYCAFLFTTSAGQYRVDWGDGSTPTLHNSNTIAQYQYDFATYDTGNTTLSSRGYKQAIITVTPVSGDLLTCNFQQRFVTSPVQNQAYSTAFLDCILSMPNASSGTSIVFGGTTVRHSFVERFEIKIIGNATRLQDLFRGLTVLKSVPLFNTQSVTNMQSMFHTCISLENISLFDTQNVESFSLFLFGCSSLKNIPLFNTQNATNIDNMFGSCSSLQSVPLFNTANVTNMNVMFQSCVSLNYVPNINTSNVTFHVNQFNGCNSLNRVELVARNTISFQNCQLSRDAIVEIFNNLVDRSSTTSATITITGNWGVTALSAGDLLIATNKNWVVVQ